MGEEESETSEVFAAKTINSILSSAGWRGIENWLNEQITKLQSRSEPAGLDNIKVDQLNYSNKKNGVKVTVVTIEKDYNRHAAKAYQLLIQQARQWRELAGEE